MWIYLSLISAFLLGIYDVAKKAAVGKNSVMWVLFISCLISALMMAPMYESGSAKDFLQIVPKCLLVSASWISGLWGMKLLPLTTSSTIKASRPVFVVLLSILLFGESLTWLQWTGVLVSLSALWMLSRSSRKEGINFASDKGVWAMWISVATGVASALYDKHIMKGLSPNFVQSWGTLGIAAVMGLALLVEILIAKSKGEKQQRFRWDWNLLLVSVSILLADMAYFHALKEPDALLSVVSLLRRGCAIVSFAISVVLFKEKNYKSKAIDLSILMAGMAILALAS